MLQTSCKQSQRLAAQDCGAFELWFMPLGTSPTLPLHASINTCCTLDNCWSCFRDGHPIKPLPGVTTSPDLELAHSSGDSIQAAKIEGVTDRGDLPQLTAAEAAAIGGLLLLLYSAFAVCAAAQSRPLRCCSGPVTRAIPNNAQLSLLVLCLNCLQSWLYILPLLCPSFCWLALLPTSNNHQCSSALPLTSA